MVISIHFPNDEHDRHLIQQQHRRLPSAALRPMRMRRTRAVRRTSLMTGSEASEVLSLVFSSATEVRVPATWKSVYSESSLIHLTRIHLSPVFPSSTVPRELTKLVKSTANFSMTSSEHCSSNGSIFHHLSCLSMEGKRLSCIVPARVCIVPKSCANQKEKGRRDD